MSEVEFKTFPDLLEAAARLSPLKTAVVEVSGEVDLVLVPDLVSGNILAKTLEYLAGATLGGVVLGAVVPIIVTS
jgi:phosphotransacetylase